MSRTYHSGERHIKVHGVRKDPVELRRQARALIALAKAEAEADAAVHKPSPGRAKQRRLASGRSRADRGDAA